MSSKYGVRHAAFAGAVTLALGSCQASAQTITAVMHANLRILDPVINSSYIVRNFGYMVYDTLLARDADNNIRPEMVEKWTVSADGKVYTFELRDGLKWHDGSAVTAEDCVASIRRWSSLDKMGQIMASLLEKMEVADAKTFTMTFRSPTDIALVALSKPSGIAAFMMPKRLANTPISEPIKEAIGSGPFRFVPGEFKPGIQAVFEKFDGYVPRNEPASGMAGGKRVKVDRVKWIGMPDSMTTVNAIQSNEIDYIENVPFDLLPLLETNKDIVLSEERAWGGQYMARLNFTQPPFNNKLLRQAALIAVDQNAVMQAQIGNPKFYKTCTAVFGCGSKYASETGAVKGNPEKAAALLKEAKYDGAPVVILQPTDVPMIGAAPPVIAQALKRAGFNVRLVATDWATVTINRGSREPVEKGGWSIFSTINNFSDIGEPIGFHAIATNGDKAWFGWPDVPKIEKERMDFALAKDEAERKQIAKQLQVDVIDEVLFVPLGEMTPVLARRKSLSAGVKAGIPVFWDMTKTK